MRSVRPACRRARSLFTVDLGFTYAFNYSEIDQGSDVTERRAQIIYEAHRNAQLSYTALIGRPLNFGNTTPPVNWLERMQFNVIDTF